MDSRRVRDFANHRILVKIDNDDLGRMREIETARSGIDRQNVPTAFATNRYLTYELVRLIAQAQSQKLSQANSQLSIEESYALLNFSFRNRQRQNGLACVLIKRADRRGRL